MTQDRDIFERATPLPVGSAFSVLDCDRYHHFYHYQSSAQYLWLAESFATLDEHDSAMTAYNKAIFQDHFNEDALKGKHLLADGEPRHAHTPSYDKHTAFDIAFCASIGELPTDATEVHDHGVRALQQHEHTNALDFFDRALKADSKHSNSYFARGCCHYINKDYIKAVADLQEAIRLSHLKHDAYHRLASSEHTTRGREFLHAGQMELAIADFSKALDLYPRNAEALLARANAYHLKGEDRLAQNDERAAQAYTPAHKTQ